MPYYYDTCDYNRYKLKDKKLQVDGMDRGEVELAIHWKFNPALEAERLKKQREEEAKFTNKVGRVFRKIGQTLGTESESESEPDDDVRLFHGTLCIHNFFLTLNKLAFNIYL